MSRLVQVTLLEHRGHGPTHWDLLFPRGQRCLTWSFYPRQRALGSDAWLFTYQLLAPHRRSYLDYSGPVSAGRGATRCLWRGMLALHKQVGGHVLSNEGLRISLAASGLASWQGQDRLQPWLNRNWAILTTPRRQHN